MSCSLSCDFDDVAERVAVKAAHGGEVNRQRFALTLLKLLDNVLHVGGDYFFSPSAVAAVSVLFLPFFCSFHEKAL